MKIDLLFLGLAIGLIWAVAWPIAALAERYAPPAEDEAEDDERIDVDGTYQDSRFR